MRPLERIAPLASATTLAVLAMFAGCAAGPAAERRDRVTAVDQTEADRRAQVRFELASAYFANGQTETALDEVKRSLAANPNFGPSFNLRGLIYASLGDDALAEASFRQALDINPRDADTMQNYGWFLCQRRRYPEAVTQFNQAIAQPQYRDGIRTLASRGICQARAGQWLEAEGSLMRAYELEPSNPGTALNLAEVLLRRGEFTRARFYIARVNAQPQTTNAQSLWLAARIEHKLGNASGVREFGDRLRLRFPQAPEVMLLDRERFDD